MMKVKSKVESLKKYVKNCIKIFELSNKYDLLNIYKKNVRFLLSQTKIYLLFGVQKVIYRINNTDTAYEQLSLFAQEKKTKFNKKVIRPPDSKDDYYAILYIKNRKIELYVNEKLTKKIKEKIIKDIIYDDLTNEAVSFYQSEEHKEILKKAINYHLKIDLEKKKREVEIKKEQEKSKKSEIDIDFDKDIEDEDIFENPFE